MSYLQYNFLITGCPKDHDSFVPSGNAIITRQQREFWESLLDEAKGFLRMPPSGPDGGGRKHELRMRLANVPGFSYRRFCHRQMDDVADVLHDGAAAAAAKMAAAAVDVSDEVFVNPKLHDSTNLARHSLWVDPDRVSIPSAAGLVDPLPFLCAERRAVLADLFQILDSEDSRGPPPRACHKVSRHDEQALLHKMMAAGMIVLVEESEIPKSRAGKVLVGG